MNKITLQSYKDFKQYFSLLDVLIKDTSSNKYLFLEDIDISLVHIEELKMRVIKSKK